MSRRYSRRMFLRGTSGCILAIPFLPSLLPREAWGQSTTPIKRYFNYVGGYDYGHHQHWYPTLDQLPNVVTPSNGDQAFRYRTLRSFISNPSQDLSLILGRGLNPYLDKMNLFRGLNLHTRIAHGRGHMLGNIAATDGHDNQVNRLKPLPTIDQVLASNRNFTPHSRDPLLLGNSYSFQKDANGNVSRAPDRWVKPDQLFTQLFTNNGMPIPENGNQQNQSHPRADILSRVLEDYQRVRNGRQISSVDRNVLENAMDQISDIQNRLGVTQGAQGCQYSDIDTSRTRTDGVQAHRYGAEPHPYAFDLYARIFAAAASCDLHRVFSFHHSLADEHYDRHPTEDFHQGHSHQPWSIVTNNTVNHQYMAQIWRRHIDNFLSKLVGYLDAIEEANGATILDNSLVHMTLECSAVHSDFSKPCLMIGSAAGALNTGYFIDYSRRELGPHRDQGDNFNNNPNDQRFGHNYWGQHYNRSLTTVLRAMGLSPNEYEDPTINRFFQGRTDGRIGQHNNGIARIGGYGHIGSENSGVWYLNDSQLHSQEYARHNYHFYKESLPLPPRGAA